MTDHDRFSLEDEAREAYLAGYHRRLSREMAVWDPNEEDVPAEGQPMRAAVALIIAVLIVLVVASQT